MLAPSNIKCLHPCTHHPIIVGKKQRLKLIAVTIVTAGSKVVVKFLEILQLEAERKR